MSKLWSVTLTRQRRGCLPPLLILREGRTVEQNQKGMDEWKEKRQGRAEWAERIVVEIRGVLWVGVRSGEQ